MALTVLRPLLGKRRGAIDVIVVDSIISERHMRTSDITEHPIQNGAFINDHVINQSPMLTMDCFISDTPQNPGILQRLSRFYTFLKPSQRTFEYLNFLWREKTLLTVVSSLKIYRRMAIESLTFDRNQQTSNALSFRITLKQINIFCRPEPLGLQTLQKLSNGLKNLRNQISEGVVFSLDAGAQVEQTTVDIIRGLP